LLAVLFASVLVNAQRGQFGRKQRGQGRPQGQFGQKKGEGEQREGESQQNKDHNYEDNNKVNNQPKQADALAEMLTHFVKSSTYEDEGEQSEQQFGRQQRRQRRESP